MQASEEGFDHGAGQGSHRVQEESGAVDQQVPTEVLLLRALHHVHCDREYIIGVRLVLESVEGVHLHLPVPLSGHCLLKVVELPGGLAQVVDGQIHFTSSTFFLFFFKIKILSSYRGTEGRALDMGAALTVKLCAGADGIGWARGYCRRGGRGLASWRGHRRSDGCPWDRGRARRGSGHCGRGRCCRPGRCPHRRRRPDRKRGPRSHGIARRWSSPCACALTRCSCRSCAVCTAGWARCDDGHPSGRRQRGTWSPELLQLLRRCKELRS